MPCSQMMRMNIRPPRPSPAMRLARFPAVNGRSLNRSSRNMGSATLVSITVKTASTARPPMMSVRTIGLGQPMVWPPQGWMP